MLFQIKEIILWPRNYFLPIRRVKFALGKVTVISGASRTGKSAIIPIIDYCLASQGCTIPVNVIRDACEWFGIIIRTNQGEKLLARREPGIQRSTDDMYIYEAETINNIPNEIKKNTTSKDVRQFLDDLAGLSKLDFSSGGALSGFDARPSFRDMSTFIFQPQNVVANPEVLFFKTDRYEHREKLRKIFPYILGAMTPDLLAKQHELNQLQNILRRKERELKSIEQVSAQWTADLQAKISEAKELGLINSSFQSELTRESMILLLEDLVNRTDISLAVSAQTISDSLQEFDSLEQEESEVSFKLASLKRRLKEMNQFKEATSNYKSGLSIQRERLQISDWIEKNRIGDKTCPICGEIMNSSEENLKEIRKSLTFFEEEAGSFFEIPASFEREKQRVQTEIEEESEKHKAIQIRKNALTLRSEEAKTQQYKVKRVERFIGNIENALNLHHQLGEDSELRIEVDQLRMQCQVLKQELNIDTIEKNKRRAISRINTNAVRLLPLLDCERPEDPVSLDITDLTLKVTGDKRDDYLSEIGSGSNWLSYYIAMMLALQQFFLAQDHSPVPGFLVMDQPSQVYFPRKLVVREQEDYEDPQLSDEDIEAVKKVFQTITSVVESSKGRFQAIILDHASKDIWGNIPNIEHFEEWRNGEKLIPANWLKK